VLVISTTDQIQANFLVTFRCPSCFILRLHSNTNHDSPIWFECRLISVTETELLNKLIAVSYSDHETLVRTLVMSCRVSSVSNTSSSIICVQSPLVTNVRATHCVHTGKPIHLLPVPTSRGFEGFGGVGRVKQPEHEPSHSYSCSSDF
jgi:hypothetical protein